MSWFKSLTESVTETAKQAVASVAEDVASMAEDVASKAGESLRKMRQVDHVERVEQDALQIRDAESAVLILSDWNASLERVVGSVTEDRILGAGAGEGVVGSSQPFSPAARGSVGTGGAAAASSKEGPADEKVLGAGSTSSSSKDHPPEPEAATAGGPAPPQLPAAANARNPLFERDGQDAGQEAAAAANRHLPKRRRVTLKHILLKSRAIEFLFRQIHASRELQAALQGCGGDNSSGGQVEETFRAEFWKLMEAVTAPFSSDFVKELIALLGGIPRTEPLPDAFFHVLNRLKLDWRADLFLTERQNLEQPMQELLASTEKNKDSMPVAAGSLKPSQILGTWNEQNKETARSAALLGVLADAHDCELFVLGRWTNSGGNSGGEQEPPTDVAPSPPSAAPHLLPDPLPWKQIRELVSASKRKTLACREKVGERTSTLAEAKKTQKEELCTQLGGLTEGKKEVVERMRILESEQAELEAKLAKVVEELNDLREQVGRVENSEDALRKESENALGFYEENLMSLKGEEEKMRREEAFFDAIGEMCERGGAAQAASLSATVEHRKTAAGEVYSSLQSAGQRHLTLESIRLRTAMALVESCVVAVQERRFVDATAPLMAGGGGAAAAASASQPPPHQGGGPGGTTAADRPLESLQLDLRKAVVLRDRCQQDLEKFLAKYAARLLKESSTSDSAVAKIREEVARHKAKQEELIQGALGAVGTSGGRASRSSGAVVPAGASTSTAEATGPSPAPGPSSGPAAALFSSATSSIPTAAFSSSFDTATSTVATASKFLTKLKDENFPAIPSSATSANSAASATAGLFSQVSADIESLFFTGGAGPSSSTPKADPKEEVDAAPVQPPRPSGEQLQQDATARASSAGVEVIKTTNMVAGGGLIPRGGGSLEAPPLVRLAEGPGGSGTGSGPGGVSTSGAGGPVEFHSIGTPTTSPSARGSGAATPAAAGAASAGEAAVGSATPSSGVAAPAPAPPPPPPGGVASAAAAPPAASAAASAASSTTAAASSTATTAGSTAPAAAAAKKLFDDDEDLFSMFDTGLDDFNLK